MNLNTAENPLVYGWDFRQMADSKTGFPPNVSTDTWVTKRTDYMGNTFYGITGLYPQLAADINGLLSTAVIFQFL